MAAASAAIQDDISRAFSVKSDRIFQRANDQVYAIVGANRALQIVSDVWFDRFDDQREFQDVLKHILSLFREGHYRFWLADLRYLTADFAASEDWLVNSLMPAVIDAGPEREAVVLPDAAVRQEGQDAYLTASRALRDIADGRVRGFTNIALAKRWLLHGELPEAG